MRVENGRKCGQDIAFRHHMIWLFGGRSLVRFINAPLFPNSCLLTIIALLFFLCIGFYFGYFCCYFYFLWWTRLVGYPPNRGFSPPEFCSLKPEALESRDLNSAPSGTFRYLGVQAFRQVGGEALQTARLSFMMSACVSSGAELRYLA